MYTASRSRPSPLADPHLAPQTNQATPEHQWKWPSRRFDLVGVTKGVDACVAPERPLQATMLRCRKRSTPHPHPMPNKSPSRRLAAWAPCCGAKLFKNRRMVHSKLMDGQTAPVGIPRSSPTMRTLRKTISTTAAAKQTSSRLPRASKCAPIPSVSLNTPLESS